MFYNQNAGNANAWTYVPDLTKPAYSDRTWENYTPRITWQATPRNKFIVLVGRAAGLPQVHGHDLVQRLAGCATTSPEADGHGEFSPQRVQRRGGRRR